MTGERVSVGGVDVATGHFIDGERVGSATTFEDRSPLDWNVKLADIARGGALEGAAAVTAAVNAFTDWPISSTPTSSASRLWNASTWRCCTKAYDCALSVEVLAIFAPTPI
jgi:hypothetical protein